MIDVLSHKIFGVVSQKFFIVGQVGLCPVKIQKDNSLKKPVLFGPVKVVPHENLNYYGTMPKGVSDALDVGRLPVRGDMGQRMRQERRCRLAVPDSKSSSNGVS